MSEGFVSYAQWLASRAAVSDAPTPPPPPEIEPPADPRNLCDDLDRTAVIGEARRFRAALREALEAVRVELLRDLAADVLGREIRLGPVDLEAIVERACARYRIDEPFTVRVAPGECAALREHAIVIEDAALRSGDAILEVRHGEIDARLGVRLERVLAGFV